MAYDGSLIFDTKIDDSGFKKGVSKLQSVGKGAVKGIVKGAAAAAAAITGIGVASIKAGSDFEAGMSRVNALTGATQAEFEKLEKKAMELGKTTVFSATQASEGMSYLAMAGFDTNEIIAAMPGLLNAAAAGQTELGTAADITSNILSGFGIDATETGRVADVLTKAFTSSNTSLESLGETMKYVGPVAKAAGFSLEETAAAAGILGDAGIQGSMAGTTLRGVMLRLVSPPKQAADALDELGVSLLDAKGEMKPFPDIIEELEKATEGMTEAQKTAIISQVAGQNAASGLLAIMDAGSDTLREFGDELENSAGTAAEIAAKQLDNLKGDVELLKSALEGTGITIYKQFDEPLRAATQAATGYIEQIEQAVSEGGFEGLANVVGNILADVLQKVTDFAPKLIQMTSDLIQSFINGIKDNAESISEAAISIMETFINMIMDLIPEVLELGIILLQNFLDGIIGALPQLIETAQETIYTLITTITENLPGLISSGIEVVISLIQGIVETIPQLIPLGLELISTVVEAIIDNKTKMIDAAVEAITALIDGFLNMLPELLELALELIMTIADGLIQEVDLLVEAAITIVDKFVEFVLNNLPQIIDMALQIIIAIMNGLLDNLDLIIDAAIQLVIAIIEAIIRMLPQLVNSAIEIVLALINGLFNALPRLIAAAIQLITSLIGAILRMIPQIIALGVQLIGELVVGLLKAIPTVVNAGKNIIKSVFSAMGASLKGAVQIGTDLVKGIWNGIKNVTSWILNKIKGFGSSIMKGIKGIFGIKSPSTLMRDEIGKNLVLGIGVGFEAETDDLNRDIEKEMSMLARNMQATVDVESANSTARMIRGGSGRDNDSTSNQDNSDNKIIITGNEFYVREEGDIEKIAIKLKQLSDSKSRARGIGVVTP